MEWGALSSRIDGVLEGDPPGYGTMNGYRAAGTGCTKETNASSKKSDVDFLNYHLRAIGGSQKHYFKPYSVSKRF